MSYPIAAISLHNPSTAISTAILLLANHFYGASAKAAVFSSGTKTSTYNSEETNRQLEEVKDFLLELNYANTDLYHKLRPQKLESLTYKELRAIRDNHKITYDKTTQNIEKNKIIRREINQEIEKIQTDEDGIMKLYDHERYFAVPEFKQKIAGVKNGREYRALTLKEKISIQKLTLEQYKSQVEMHEAQYDRFETTGSRSYSSLLEQRITGLENMHRLKTRRANLSEKLTAVVVNLNEKIYESK